MAPQPDPARTEFLNLSGARRLWAEQERLYQDDISSIVTGRS